MVFIHIQLQNINTFVDETSGLFNRKYMNFYLEKAHKTNPRQLYGIMMDVNDFKKINDRLRPLYGRPGHSGDRQNPFRLPAGGRCCHPDGGR